MPTYTAFPRSTSSNRTRLSCNEKTPLRWGFFVASQCCHSGSSSTRRSISLLPSILKVGRLDSATSKAPPTFQKNLLHQVSLPKKNFAAVRQCCASRRRRTGIAPLGRSTVLWLVIPEAQWMQARRSLAEIDSGRVRRAARLRQKARQIVREVRRRKRRQPAIILFCRRLLRPDVGAARGGAGAGSQQRR